MTNRLNAGQHKLLRYRIHYVPKQVTVGAADAGVNNVQNVLVIRKTLVLLEKERYFISNDLMM